MKRQRAYLGDNGRCPRNGVFALFSECLGRAAAGALGVFRGLFFLVSRLAGFGENEKNRGLGRVSA